ncbi:hypothetical protein N657DRAFT_492143 [Parathielavia appendiculata]|uniref:Uncharacterized protein n=1 Tax=Parathielavia appendiculata TaxID=2587402 RepID=A0AAN6Z2Z3_9PEZI|nr:hypothetical protein N657DRAFT_492143 [Parathielavia appendiculata]
MTVSERRSPKDSPYGVPSSLLPPASPLISPSPSPPPPLSDSPDPASTSDAPLPPPISTPIETLAPEPDGNTQFDLPAVTTKPAPSSSSSSSSTPLGPLFISSSTVGTSQPLTTPPNKTFTTHRLPLSSPVSTSHSPSISTSTEGSDIIGLGSSNDNNNNFNLVKIAVPSVAGGVVLFFAVFAACWWLFVARVKARAEKARQQREAKGKGREVVVVRGPIMDANYHMNGGFAELGEGSGTQGQVRGGGLGEQQHQQELGYAPYGIGRYEAHELMRSGDSRGRRWDGEENYRSVTGLGIQGGKMAPALAPELPANYEGDRYWHGV